MNKKITLMGFLSAVALLAYVFLVALFFSFAERLMGEKPGFSGFGIFLLLLVFSASLCGTLMFGRPIYLFLNNFKKESIWQIVSNLVWVFVLLVLVVLTKFIFNW
ncbi:MAG: hypothetical protein NTU97_02700 [Candidatus Magasanikbacteria bacterium]|nr:hypothetical protein [Candidatus Magasanikbacteria bacterium]